MQVHTFSRYKGGYRIQNLKLLTNGICREGIILQVLIPLVKLFLYSVHQSLLGKHNPRTQA